MLLHGEGLARAMDSYLVKKGFKFLDILEMEPAKLLLFAPGFFFVPYASMYRKCDQEAINLVKKFIFRKPMKQTVMKYLPKPTSLKTS